MSKIFLVYGFLQFLLCCSVQSDAQEAIRLQVTTERNNASVLPGSQLRADPCVEAKAYSEAATGLSKTIIYDSALQAVLKAYTMDGKEHVVAFGKDENGNMITSLVSTGKQSNGTVPWIQNAFADLHNHPGNHPPDAGDLYGLIDISQSDIRYNTRYIITGNNNVYALVVTNPTVSSQFSRKYPRDLGGCAGCSPKFPEAIVDEFREIKYRYGSSDEAALAFILEKYNTGIALLKQEQNGVFNKIMTSITGAPGNLVYTVHKCQ